MSTRTTHPANLTRRTANLAGKLRRERRYGFLALYHILRLSDLGREGIERSGSYRFADHVYANRATGRGTVGRIIDRILLSLPATRAMRQRCTESTAAMRQAYREHCASGTAEPFRLLTVPCGLPRDVADFVDSIGSGDAKAPPCIEYTGLDLDPMVLAAARDYLAHSAVPLTHWVEGDALAADSYPGGEKFHFIASTGLGEFLDNTQLAQLYGNIHDRLAPGGVFFTSATSFEPHSDAMRRAFELQTHYRTREDIEPLLAACGWREVRFTYEKTGLQTFVQATKT